MSYLDLQNNGEDTFSMYKSSIEQRNPRLSSHSSQQNKPYTCKNRYPNLTVMKRTRDDDTNTQAVLASDMELQSSLAHNSGCRRKFRFIKEVLYTPDSL